MISSHITPQFSSQVGYFSRSHSRSSLETPAFGFQIKAFFLLCVIVAGVYGAATVSRRILYVQAAPAAIALLLLWLA